MTRSLPARVISFIHTQILVHLHVNKTNFRMKGFALGLASETEVTGNHEPGNLLRAPLFLFQPRPALFILR